MAKKQKYGKHHKYKRGKFVNFDPSLPSNWKRGKQWQDNRFESGYTRRNDRSIQREMINLKSYKWLQQTNTLYYTNFRVGKNPML